MTVSKSRTLLALSLSAALGLGFTGPGFAQDGSGSKSEATDPIMGVEGADLSETDGSPAVEGEMPSNEVGEKFELPRYSEDNQVELITGLCGIQMKNMSKPACTCLAEESMDGLSDPQRDYLIASVVAPPVGDRMLNDGRVNDTDQAEIFGFLETYSETCRNKFADSSAETQSAPAGGGSAETGKAPAASDTPSNTATPDATESGSSN